MTLASAADQNGDKADLKCINVAETILYMTVNDKLCQTQDLTTQMKCVAET